MKDNIILTPVHSAEEILGFKPFNHLVQTYVPGTVLLDDRRFVYFSDNGKKSFKKTFKFLDIDVPPELCAKNGSAGQEHFWLFSPDGQMFHAIAYTGDFDGWERELKYCAQQANLTLGWIKDGQFILDDGRTFALTDCRAQFYGKGDIVGPLFTPSV